MKELQEKMTLQEFLKECKYLLPRLIRERSKKDLEEVIELLEYIQKGDNKMEEAKKDKLMRFFMVDGNCLTIPLDESMVKKLKRTRIYPIVS